MNERVHPKGCMCGECDGDGYLLAALSEPPRRCRCGLTDETCDECGAPICRHCAAVWEDGEGICQDCERKAREAYESEQYEARKEAWQ